MKLNVGQLIPLELQLSDGNTGMFPRALVYNAAGSLLSTVDLTHVAQGRYANDTLTMTNTPYTAVTFIVYSDSGHTTLAPYAESSEVWQLGNDYVATVTSATTTTITCNRGETATDYFKDAFVRYLTGALKGQTKKIGGYTTGVITLASGFAFTGSGANGDIIEIITK